MSVPAMIVLGVSDRCNFNCCFCLDRRYKGTGAPSLKEIAGAFRRIRQSGAKEIMLMKGESLIRGDILEILDLARAQGLDIALTTNGSMLSRYDLLEKIVKRGVVRIKLSLHSHRPKTAYAISRFKKCFVLQRSALKNIDALNARRARGAAAVPLKINTVVCRQNYRHLKGIVRYLKNTLKRTPWSIKFKALIVQDPNDQDARRSFVSPMQARPHLKETVRLLAPSQIKFSGFPLCALSPYEWASVELRELAEKDTFYLEDISSGDLLSFSDVADDAFFKRPICRKCSLVSLCPGMLKLPSALSSQLRPEPSRRAPEKIWAAYRRFGNRPPS